MPTMTPEHRKLLETIAETRFPDEDETSNLAAIALAEIDSLTARLEAVVELCDCEIANPKAEAESVALAQDVLRAAGVKP